MRNAAKGFRGLLLAAMVVALAACNRQPPLERQARHDLELGKASWATPQLWAKVATLECRPTRMDVCDADGCTSSKSATFIRLTPGNGSYQRCDSKGCNSYHATVSYSGIWTTFALPGAFARVTSDRNFVEVAALNDVLYLYRGDCKETH
jgi:hypothetical protein